LVQNGDESGMLKEGHSLIKLCKSSMEFDDGLKNYLKDCAFVNTYYIETRYPAEDPLNVSKDDVIECLRITRSLIDYINNLINKSTSTSTN